MEKENEGILEVNEVISPSSSRFKRICVFCGSSTGKRDAYKQAAIQLGQKLNHTQDFNGQRGETIGEIKAVENMHQRKAEMGRLSDCFIALPGGLTECGWIIGYYNSLLTFIDKAVDDGFIKPYQRNIFVSAPTAKELVLKLEGFKTRVWSPFRLGTQLSIVDVTVAMLNRCLR